MISVVPAAALMAEWITRESRIGRLGQEPDRAGAIRKWSEMGEANRRASVHCLAGDISTAARIDLDRICWPAYCAALRAAPGDYAAADAAFSSAGVGTPEERVWIEASAVFRAVAS